MQRDSKEVEVVDEVEIEQTMYKNYKAKAKNMKDKATYFQVHVAHQRQDSIAYTNFSRYWFSHN